MISALLSIILIMAIVPFNTFATDDFDISDYTWEDIMSMSNSEYRELLTNFERVYDPFDTYQTDPLMGTQELPATPSIGGIQPYWTSGKTDLSETGTHELITARACGVLLTDKGFWGENHNGSILIALTVSLASILPDKLTVNGEVTDLAPLDMFSGHFYNPDTEKSWNESTSNTARTNAEFFYIEAKNEYVPNDFSNNFLEYVGRMLHYIQDASEPHHAANIIAYQYGNVHGKFEDFAYSNIDSYINSLTTMSNYEYQMALTKSPGVLVYETAKIAKDFSSQVKDAKNQTQWARVAGSTTRNAVRYSTLLLYKISVEAGIPLTQ